MTQPHFDRLTRQLTASSARRIFCQDENERRVSLIYRSLPPFPLCVATTILGLFWSPRRHKEHMRRRRSEGRPTRRTDKC